MTFDTLYSIIAQTYHKRERKKRMVISMKYRPGGMMKDHVTNVTFQLIHMYKYEDNNCVNFKLHNETLGVLCRSVFQAEQLYNLIISSLKAGKQFIEIDALRDYQ